MHDFLFFFFFFVGFEDIHTYLDGGIHVYLVSFVWEEGIKEEGGVMDISHAKGL